MTSRRKRTISFTQGMIELIKQGEKTQTRRIIDTQPNNINQQFSTIVSSTCRKDEGKHRYTDPKNTNDFTCKFRSKYGYEGDLLTIKEDKILIIKIQSIRAERLHNIGEKDIIAEGIKSNKPFFNPRDVFQITWETIYGKRSWKNNPYVWVIDFKLVTKEEVKK